MPGIEQTRKVPAGLSEPAAPHKPRGLLDRARGEQFFRIRRFTPSDDIGRFVERYWTVQWDVPIGRSYSSANVPHPNANLVFEADKTAVRGVVTRTFSYDLRGSGVVLGVTFRPGGLYPFVRKPVARYTDRAVDPHMVFSACDSQLESRVLSAQDANTAVQTVERWLRSQLPAPDRRIATVCAIVDRIVADPQITKVRQIVEHFAICERTLQHLFHTYVGVGPKWVITRYRLIQAIDHLATAQAVDWAAIALDLGYADQSHLIREFTALIGTSSAAYLAATRV